MEWGTSASHCHVLEVSLDYKEALGQPYLSYKPLSYIMKHKIMWALTGKMQRVRQDGLRDFPGREQGMEGHRTNAHCQAAESVSANNIKGEE